jgi:hypothetical protein
VGGRVAGAGRLPGDQCASMQPPSPAAVGPGQAHAFRRPAAHMPPPPPSTKHQPPPPPATTAHSHSPGPTAPQPHSPTAPQPTATHQVDGILALGALLVQVKGAAQAGQVVVVHVRARAPRLLAPAAHLALALHARRGGLHRKGAQAQLVLRVVGGWAGRCVSGGWVGLRGRGRARPAQSWDGQPGLALGAAQAPIPGRQAPGRRQAAALPVLGR